MYFTVRSAGVGYRVYDPQGVPVAWHKTEVAAQEDAVARTAAAAQSANLLPVETESGVKSAPEPVLTPGYTTRQVGKGWHVIDPQGRPIGWYARETDAVTDATSRTRMIAKAAELEAEADAAELAAAAPTPISAAPVRPRISRPTRPANAPSPTAGGLAATGPASTSGPNVPYATAQFQAWMTRRVAAAPTVATAPTAVPASGGFWTGFNFGTDISPRSGDGFASRARSTVRRARAYVRLARMRAHRAARRAGGRAGTHGFGGMGMGFGAGGNVAAAAFAARAMGVGGGGAVGQAIGAAGRIGAAFEVAGPAGAAAVAAMELARALKDAVNSAHAFAEGVNASNRRLAPYSGVAAQAMAQFEVGEIRRTMDLAARTAQGAAGLARQVNRMEDAWQDWNVGVSALRNEWASAGAGLSGTVGKGLSPVGRLIEAAKARIDPTGDIAAAAGGAVGGIGMVAGATMFNPILGAMMAAWLKWGPDIPAAAKDIGPWGRFLRDAPTMGGSVHPRRLVAM